MSETQPDEGAASAGLFTTFRAAAPEVPPPHASIWRELAKNVPQTEEDWQAARRRHGFHSAEAIPGTLTQLLNRKESDLRKIVLLAGCIVDSHCAGNKAHAYSAVRASFKNDKLSEVVIVRYMREVAKLTKLLDELYLSGLRHRAFEALLYIPVKLSHIRQYVENNQRFKSHFSTAKPPPEIQGSAAPCIQFLVGLQRPDLSYDRICEALGTRLFDQQEFRRFLLAIRDGNLVPYLPPLPTFTPPLRIIQHFVIFSLSERLQKRALKSADQLRGYDPALPGVTSESDLYAYEWSTEYQAMVDETIHCLGSLHFLVEGEYFQKTSRAIHHKSGPLLTPIGKFQVIIPIPKVSKNESIINNGRMLCTVSLNSGLRETQETWSFKSGFLMNQGTSLLTQVPIDYILIRL
ncbi:hypothetical protein FALCPG4_007749 [Fusarium falciforme]